ncbi:MAG TPA: hypothetical protein PKE65_09795, partial [Rhizobiaceae bacterium]|nr:hypothetical protein [Rhizobiaceae bacterium]
MQLLEIACVFTRTGRFATTSLIKGEEGAHVTQAWRPAMAGKNALRRAAGRNRDRKGIAANGFPGRPRRLRPGGEQAEHAVV